MKGRSPNSEPEGHVRIGQIVSPHGVKGTVRVSPLTDFLDRFDSGRSVFIGDVSHKILAASWHKNQVRLDLQGIETFEAAEALRWTYLTVLETDRPDLDADEYLSSDLLGLSVYEGLTYIGIVDNVVKSPAHDLLQVGDILIPAVSQFVKGIDLEARRISVELIEGLRPGDTAEEVR